MSVFLPCLHNLVNPVKVEDCFGFTLSLTFVILSKHHMEIFLFTQDNCLVEADLQKFLLKCKLAERSESFFENTKTKGTASYPLGLAFEANLFECFKTSSDQVKLIFIVLEICLLHDCLSQIQSFMLIKFQCSEYFAH